MRAPEFGMTLLDGQVTTANIVDEGKLYFHATIDRCRAELRSIKEQVGTGYDDSVADLHRRHKPRRD